MTYGQRLASYGKWAGNLTPRQRRRVNHKLGRYKRQLRRDGATAILSLGKV